MYPLVGEVNFHTVDVVHFDAGLPCVHCLHLGEDGIHVGGGIEVNAVLGDGVVGVGGTELANGESGLCLAFVCQVAEEEGNADEGITAIVGGGVDDTAVAFTADDGVGLLHLCHHVHFAYSGSIVLLAVLAGHVAQGAGGREVAHGVARGVLEDVVCHSDEGVFLTVHLAVFTNEGEAVHVGVNYEADILAAFRHEAHDVAQVLLQWLWVVLEITCRFSVEGSHIFYA